MTDAIASVDWILVAGVFPPSLANLIEVAKHIGTCEVQHWTDQLNSRRQRPAWGDAAKPSDTAAPNDAVQHGFGLVVGRVGGGDPLGSGFSGHLRQKLVSQSTGGRFDVFSGLLGNGPNVGIAQPTNVGSRERSDENRIIVAFLSSQSVVKMGKDDSPGSRKFPERPKHGQAVCSAGNSQNSPSSPIAKNRLKRGKDGL